MKYDLTQKEKDFITQKVKEKKETSGEKHGFGGDKHIVEQVTTSYIQQREALKSGLHLESNNAADKLGRYEAAARGNYGDSERQDKQARLKEKINKALSGHNVGFVDMKRIIADTSAEFEVEELFKKMKF